MTSTYQVCKHRHFQVKANVIRFGDNGEAIVDVKVTCWECLLPFKFLGLPPGVNLNGATVAFDGLEARLAIKPKESPRDRVEE